MNETRSNSSGDAKVFFATIVVFTLIGSVAVLLLELSLQFYFKGPEYILPKYLRIADLCFAPVPGFLFGLWYAKKQLNKQFWELTETTLTCGPSRQQVFQLSAIDKIIVGLPTGLAGKILRNDKPGSIPGKSLDALSATDPTWKMVRKVYLPAKENSLVLCFDDGSWLPLCLYSIPNGAAIMNELRERFSDRLVHDHNYSPEEIRRLRRRDINELLPK